MWQPGGWPVATANRLALSVDALDRLEAAARGAVVLTYAAVFRATMVEFNDRLRRLHGSLLSAVRGR